MMKRLIALGLMAAYLAACPAAGPVWAGDILSDVLPLFNTRPSLSSKVIVSDACWRTCVAECSSVFHVCNRQHALNGCRAQSDACDLGCQKTCRTYGGPLLDVTNSD
jgi:hypothetical protein